MIASSSKSFINTKTIDPYHPGELNGLTFAIKDNIDVANEITGYGSPWWAEMHSRPLANAVCVDQLLSAAPRCLGKTHCDELARSLIGINPFYGIPLNPKAPSRAPGGSSSGSASAVACGLVDFALGTDTGGSVRVPASNCGVWGYRPSHGVISVAGVASLAPNFDTVGVFTNTGQVLERVMQVLLAEDRVEQSVPPSICFLKDVFQLCDDQIQEAMLPIMADIDCSALTDKYVSFTLDEAASNIESPDQISKNNENDPGFTYGPTYYAAAVYCNFPGQETLYYVGTIPAHREYYFGPLIPAQKVTVEVPILVL